MTLDAVNQFGSNDNQFISSGSPSYFDIAGLSFNADGVDYNIFDLNGTYAESSANGTGYYTDPNR